MMPMSSLIVKINFFFNFLFFKQCDKPFRGKRNLGGKWPMISHLWKTAAVLISRTKWNNAFIFPLNKWKHDSSGNTIKQNPCPYIKLQVIEEITFSSAFDLKISQFLMPQIKKKTNVQRNIGLIEEYRP